MSHTQPPMLLSPERLVELTEEFSRQDPTWAGRLMAARSDRELLDLVRQLLNLSHAVEPAPCRKEVEQ